MTSTEPKPVWSEGKVHVMAEMCSTCVFRPGNLMDLSAGVLKSMIEGSVAGGAGITCHKTLSGQAPQQAVCRGFLETHGTRVPVFRLARAMDLIEEVDP